jgi:Na+/H+-dicarboxylate symporter
MRFFWLVLVALGLGTKRHWHIFFAILFGVILGFLFSGDEYHFLHSFFDVVGQVFLRLITMLVLPLVVSSLVVGVSSLGDARSLGRMGGKVFSLFLLFMISAAVIGGGLAYVIEPGKALMPQIQQERERAKATAAATPATPTNTANPLTEKSPANNVSAVTTVPVFHPPGAVTATATATTPMTESGWSQAKPAMAPSPGPDAKIPNPHDLTSGKLQVETPDLKQLFFNMIPQNVVKSLANAELVPVILFTFIFGAALATIGDAGKPLIAFFEALYTATMKVTDWVMVLSVPGVFSLAFVTVATSGIGVFRQLLLYILVLLIGLLIQAFIVFPLILRLLAKVDFLNLYRAISEALMVAFGTASSSATLPVTIACCERRAGISNRIASFVLPTSVTINKTATTMFEVIAVMFLAQAYGVELSPLSLALVLVFAVVASMGTAGIPSAGLITIAIVFQSMGQNFTPALFGTGLAMLWSIDRILDMCRSVVNVMSGCVVATIVASFEGELNRDLLNNRESWSEVV